MVENRKSKTKLWAGLFRTGQIIILMASLAALPFSLIMSWKYQPILAVLLSLTWYASSFLSSKTPSVIERQKNYPRRLFWIGSVQVLLAVLLWIFIPLRSQIAAWAAITSLMFGMYGLVILYNSIIFYFFPNLLQMISSRPPNPLAEFTVLTQEVINKGKHWVNVLPVIVIFVFFMVAGIGNMIIDVTLREGPTDFFLIVMLVGFMVAFATGFFATIKWQKWARKSGVPEEELKSAAKAAKLWWPKTKEE